MLFLRNGLKLAHNILDFQATLKHTPVGPGVLVEMSSQTGPGSVRDRSRSRPRWPSGRLRPGPHVQHISASVVEDPNLTVEGARVEIRALWARTHMMEDELHDLRAILRELLFEIRRHG